MPRISASIISFNEEAKIGACLESLEGVVDEIVVVDSGSTDRTVEIAREKADRVLHQDFLGHVGQKTFALEQVSHDWVLSVDCDERLTPELRASILAVKDELGSGHSAYSMTRRTFYVWRFLNHMWYPEYVLRLFDRRRTAVVGRNPHDRFATREGTTGVLRGDVLHYSFMSLSDHLQTIDRFTEIAARGMVADGRRANLLDPVLHGAWTFLRLYLLKAGLLDGFAGFTASFLSGVHAYTKYAKVLALQRGAEGSWPPREG